jgi:type I restriction enzyme R subunit
MDVLHPTNVTQKVQFIIEHFSKNVAHRLDGKAKAMVVTSSRAAAIRYKKALTPILPSTPSMPHPLTDCLLRQDDGQAGDARRRRAFKDDVFIVDENEEFTEESMNPDVKGQDLRLAFDRPEYRVMLVADKFQTGFDQPKLVAHVCRQEDRQRCRNRSDLLPLNRMAPGKDEVFIIDFVNDPENVRRAFAMYDDGAQIDDVQDLNVVYEIKEQLDGQGLYEARRSKPSRKPASRPSATSRMLRSRSTRRCMPRPKGRRDCSTNA